jgi:hypothetical protein
VPAKKTMKNPIPILYRNADIITSKSSDRIMTRGQVTKIKTTENRIVVIYLILRYLRISKFEAKIKSKKQPSNENTYCK